MNMEKVNRLFRKAYRLFAQHFLMFGHWWAVASILAIASWYHPTLYTTLFGMVLFVVLLFKRKALALTFLITFLLSLVNVYWQEATTFNPPARTEWHLTLKTIPKIDGDGLTADFKLDQGGAVRGLYKIKSKQEKLWLMERLKVGMTCRLVGTLKKPDPPSNFNAFDYPAYLKHHGITSLLQISTIESCRDEAVNFLDRIKRIRQSGIELVNHTFSESVRGITNALVFGERNFMSPDVLEAYQTLGLVHLLAVSGLHVGIVIGLCYLLFLRLGFVKEHVHLILLLIIIPLYAILTGLSASVLRASLMIALALLSPFLKLKIPPLSIISMACVILLFIDPDMLFDIGFELSFLIAFSIIISARTIERRYRNVFLRTFVMTGIAQIAALPIILYNFHSISILSFFLNLFFIPFISLVILPLSIITVLIMTFLPAVANSFVRLLSFLIEPSHAFLLQCEHLSFFNVVTGRPSGIGLLLLIVGVAILLVLWEKWQSVFSAFLPIGFILFVGLAHFFLLWASPYGAVTYLDVGQGDSILIQLPHHGGTMLIDTGGTLPFKQASWQKRRDPFDIGRDIVAEQIKAEGVSKINWLVLTHRDMDHIGGFKGLMGSVPIDNIVISQEFETTELEKSWFKIACGLGIHIQRVPSGALWGIDDLFLKVLWPESFEPTSNNRSLVLFAKLGGKSWLFTGDLEKEGELSLIERYPRMHIDILKVGHHGSRTSSTPDFIKTIKPRIAVISVGENNRFGHPHPDVLKTLRNQHVKILRTDEHGAIKIRFTKERIVSIIQAKK